MAKRHVYDKCGFTVTNFTIDKESIEYGGCTFILSGKVITHRVAKSTPTKNGQFVTLWKRNVNGATEPFDYSDKFDLIVITTRSGDNLGQFIFPKSVLLDNGVISGKDKKGKRGIRVYPPWDTTTSRQAENSQQWQTKYFLTINGSATLVQAKKLFDKV